MAGSEEMITQSSRSRITAITGALTGTGMIILTRTASRWKEGQTDLLKDGKGILNLATASPVITDLRGKTKTTIRDAGR